MRKPYSLLLTLLLLLLLSSCRTTQYVPLPEVRHRDSLVTRVNTRVDSIYIDRWHSIQQRADTVYRTDSVYVEKYRYLAKHDTITVTTHDSIYVPVPVEPPPRKSLALSERVRVLGKGCLLGGIGAFLLLIAMRLYLRR